MKQKISIIALLLLVQAIAFKMSAFSQDRNKCPSVINSVQKEGLLADETTIKETKSGMQIKSSNKDIIDKILSKFDPETKRAMWKWSKEQRGEKEYVMYVSKELGTKIIEWAKLNL